MSKADSKSKWILAKINIDIGHCQTIQPLYSGHFLNNDTYKSQNTCPFSSPRFYSSTGRFEGFAYFEDFKYLQNPTQFFLTCSFCVTFTHRTTLTIIFLLVHVLSTCIIVTLAWTGAGLVDHTRPWNVVGCIEAWESGCDIGLENNLGTEGWRQIWRQKYSSLHVHVRWFQPNESTSKRDLCRSYHGGIMLLSRPIPANLCLVTFLNKGLMISSWAWVNMLPSKQS
jgi:hypothetical protein